MEDILRRIKNRQGRVSCVADLAIGKQPTKEAKGQTPGEMTHKVMNLETEITR